MKKPLLITYEYPPDIGGVGKYLEQEVLDFGGEVKIMLAQNYSMALWPRWLALVWHGCYQLRKNKCDGLWVSHILPIGYIALIYKKIFNIPYRLYLHGLDVARPRASKWKSFWVRVILKHADEIICNSKATAELLAYYNKELIGSMGLSRLSANPSEGLKGLAIRYPRAQKINPQDYAQVGRKLRQKYHLKNKKILLSIARLVKRKGVDLVIRALPDVWKEIPDLTYVVIGDGEEAEHLKQIAGNNPNVIFMGAISDQEKYAWLSTCDCFILTPRNDPNDFEGYGIVYKEAQMFGKPIIGSRVGGVPEAIGDDGIIIEPDNINEISKAICKALKYQ